MGRVTVLTACPASASVSQDNYRRDSDARHCGPGNPRFKLTGNRDSVPG